MKKDLRSKRNRISLEPVLTITLCCLVALVAETATSAHNLRRTFHFPQSKSQLIAPKPLPAPARFRGLIGEYGPDDDVLIIFEMDGQLRAHHARAERERLNEMSKDVFKGASSAPGYDVFVFTRDRKGRATQVTIDAVVLKRRQIEPETGNQLRIKPVRPVPELMKEALAAQPPLENGDFLPSDLVELAKLDPTIRLEVRYATTNNFLGTKFYSRPRFHAATRRRSRRAR
jgi:serine beta-lactamase-like protein LACTB